ncbi:contact-dependent growth inhibition system immunity protein [Streptomyces cyaneofuscatus]|uniref:contact-dependent growth inhibition system immunity protein n=1 Tax=Streptomyces cyaneofuscatus TaxID=66883 RepID=UPI0036625475
MTPAWAWRGPPARWGCRTFSTSHTATTDPQLVARLVGELHELLALPLDDGDYALAAAELGMEVGPPEPFSHGAWFQSLATTLSSI